MWLPIRNSPPQTEACIVVFTAHPPSIQDVRLQKMRREVGRGRIKICRLRRFGHIHRNCAIIAGSSRVTASLQPRSRRRGSDV